MICLCPYDEDADYAAKARSAATTEATFVEADSADGATSFGTTNDSYVTDWTDFTGALPTGRIAHFKC